MWEARQTKPDIDWQHPFSRVLLLPLPLLSVSEVGALTIKHMLKLLRVV